MASRLPLFACLTPTKMADCRRIMVLCEHLAARDIAIFDRACNDFASLAELDRRNVFCVVREKDGMCCNVVRGTANRRAPKNALSDEMIRLTGARTSKSHPQTLRRIRAKVEVDGREWADLMGLLKSHGIAPRPPGRTGTQPPCLPGFEC